MRRNCACAAQALTSLSYLHATSDCVDPRGTKVIGSCTGLLAATALCSSRVISDLPNLGTALVRIAFRVGVTVAESRDRLQQGSKGQASWSVAVAESSEDAIKATLEQFHAKKVRLTTISSGHGFLLYENRKFQH